MLSDREVAADTSRNNCDIWRDARSRLKMVFFFLHGGDHYAGFAHARRTQPAAAFKRLSFYPLPGCRSLSRTVPDQMVAGFKLGWITEMLLP